MFTGLYAAINGLGRFEHDCFASLFSSSITISEGKSTPTLKAAKVADAIISTLAVLTAIGGLIVGLSTGITSFGIAGAAGLCALFVQTECREGIKDRIKSRLAFSHALGLPLSRAALPSAATSGPRL